MPLTLTSIDAHELFQLAFTRCRNDPIVFILDLRDKKHFGRQHIATSYNIRLASDKTTLLDQSQNAYKIPWSHDAYWGHVVIVYDGQEGVKRNHPVVQFLEAEGRAARLLSLKAPFDSFASLYPHCVTASVRANCVKQYPSQIIPQELYLGDWDHAENIDLLHDLGIRRVVTLHNHPERLVLPNHIDHLKFTIADVDVEDISQFFDPIFDFVYGDRDRATAPTLVHCGAGVSRSACCVMALLMRRQRMNADRAEAFVRERRSAVALNDGFKRSLIAYEPLVGVVERSVAAARSRSRSRSPPRRPLNQVQVCLALQVYKDGNLVDTIRLAPFSPGTRVIFGRLPTCDIVCAHESISRQHAHLTLDVGGALLVADLGAAHGTNVDGVWIRAKSTREVKDGSEIRLGGSTRVYRICYAS